MCKQKNQTMMGTLKENIGGFVKVDCFNGVGISSVTGKLKDVELFSHIEITPTTNNGDKTKDIKIPFFGGNVPTAIISVTKSICGTPLYASQLPPIVYAN